MKVEENMLNQQFESIKLQQEAENWQNQALMENAFDKA